MGFWNNIFAKSRDKPNGNIPTGRLSGVNNEYSSTLSPYRSRSRDLLRELRGISDEADAIEFITKKTPDASMSLWNFVRYANQGHTMRFYDINNKEKPLDNIESEWRDFASSINIVSNAGLDGMVDIFHKNGVLFGSQMCEVEVNDKRTDIVEVHPIDPRTIYWEWVERNGKKIIVPYQYNGTKKVDLSKGNFFYVPLDPDANDPKGTLIMAPALQAVDSQLQTFIDVNAVLHHQGYPKNDVSIDVEKLMQICPQYIKNDSVKLTEWLSTQINNVRSNLENMAPDSDYVHTSDTTINMNSGANASRSLDIRAVSELNDVQMNNGLKQLSTFTNRHNGKTETYSSVEMKIFVQGILSLQRGSKRLVESIATLWLRVKGYQAIPVFTHNVVDWQSELDKEEVATSKLNRYAIAAIMNWVDNDTAAKEAMGVKKAVGNVPTESVKVSFSNGGLGIDNDKQIKENTETI